jgi:hypothetical protein
MNDLTLAALGIGLGLGSTAGWWARGKHHRRNPTRQEKLARRIYRHVDDIIGATKHENQLRADARFRVIHKRRWYWWLVPFKAREGIADFLWPVPRIGPGVNPIPSDRRIAWYVQASPDLRTWSIRYSPEAAANHPQFVRYLTEGSPTKGGGLAQALGREWSPNLFQVERDWSGGLVRLTLADRSSNGEKPPPRPPMDVRSAR